MRTSRNPLYLSLALLAFVFLSACDGAEQNVDFQPGENLSISGSATQTLADFDTLTTGEYNIYPFTIAKDYTWDLDGGDGGAIVGERRDGEFVDLEFTEPGTYTLGIDDGEYTGSLPITVDYRTPEAQADGSGFGILATALAAAGLSDSLAAGGPFTILAPTNEAFLAALDTSGNDAIEVGELPGAEVLGDILLYHVISDSLGTEDVMPGQDAETLEGSTVTFRPGLSVEDGSALTDDAALTDVTNKPTNTGLLHGIDGLLLPPSASVSFEDQDATNDSTGVTVRSVYLPEGGFIAVHDSTLLDDPPVVAGSVIGVSEKLEPGLYNGVEITLFSVPGQDFDEDTVLEGEQTLIAMPHFDTNGNGVYDFVTSDGAEDGPYTEDGGTDDTGPIVDPALVAP